jgi:magnesium-transporting ATPase (P-type)
MDFNKKQRMILTIGIVIIILMGLLPPWALTFSDESAQLVKRPAGYAFIATPPRASYYNRGVVLDVSRLSVQWIVVLFATGLGVFLSGRSNRNN